MGAKKKKKQNNNRRKTLKQNNGVTNHIQATAEIDPKNANQNKSVGRYFGLTAKTWTILTIVFSSLTFIIFLIIPYVIGLCVATKKGTLVDFLSKINYFTIFLSIIGTISSILSIIMTFIDRKRYSEEKEQSDKLLSKLTDVSINVETIQEENHSIKLEVLQIKDKIKMSKEVKGENKGKWLGKEHSGEINDDE